MACGDQAVQIRPVSPPGLQSAAMMHHSTSAARRQFLKFLAASPYVATLGGVASFLQRSAFAQHAPEIADVIADPAAALSVFDFEEAAHRKVQAGQHDLAGEISEGVVFDYDVAEFCWNRA